MKAKDFLFEKKNVREFTKDDILAAFHDIDVDPHQYDVKNVMLGMKIESDHGSKYGNDVNLTGDQSQPTLKLVIANLRKNPRYYTDFYVPAMQKMQNNVSEGLRALASFKAFKNRIYEAAQADSAPSFNTFVNQVTSSDNPIKLASGILPICKSTGKILLCKRGTNMPQEGTWAGIGGKLEQDNGESEENIIDVAKREFTEETAYKNYYSIIPSYIYISPNGGFKYYNFIGLFDEEFEPVLNTENSEGKWVSLDEISKMKKDDVHFGIRALFMNDPDIIKKYAK